MKTIQFRISDEDKKEAEDVLEAIGLDLPTALRVFLKKVSQVRGIPFVLTIDPFMLSLEKRDQEKHYAIMKGSDDSKKRAHKQ